MRPDCNILHRRKTTIPAPAPAQRTPLHGVGHHLVVLSPKRLQLAVVSVRVPAVAGDVHDQHRLGRVCVRWRAREHGRKYCGSAKATRVHAVHFLDVRSDNLSITRSLQHRYIAATNYKAWVKVLLHKSTRSRHYISLLDTFWCTRHVL